jgi:hypothetical protein
MSATSVGALFGAVRTSSVGRRRLGDPRARAETGHDRGGSGLSRECGVQAPERGEREEGVKHVGCDAGRRESGISG